MSAKKATPTDTQTKELHEKFLYPIVRVASADAKGVRGGSGIVVYSRPRKGESKYETFVLTNHHVIGNLIEVTKKWNPGISRDVKVETRAEPTVELFGYEDLSYITDAMGKRADVVAWDEQMDLALVQIKSTQPFEHVAPIISQKSARDKLRIFTPVFQIGCALGVPPLVTEGRIGGFDFLIDNYPYTLTTAPGIFGNSGGAVMLQETAEVIGVTARMPVIFIGFGGNAVTHMMWSIPASTIYKFLEEQKYDFIVNPKRTPAQCEKERESLKKKAYEALVSGGPDEDLEGESQEGAENDDNS